MVGRGPWAESPDRRTHALLSARRRQPGGEAATTPEACSKSAAAKLRMTFENPADSLWGPGRQAFGKTRFVSSVDSGPEGLLLLKTDICGIHGAKRPESPVFQKCGSLWHGVSSTIYLSRAAASSRREHLGECACRFRSAPWTRAPIAVSGGALALLAGVRTGPAAGGSDRVLERTALWADHDCRQLGGPARAREAHPAITCFFGP